jgi:hypothetical protein
MPGVSISKLRKAEKRVLSLQNASASARRKAGELMETVLNAGVTGGTAFGLGFWSSKNGGVMPALGPVPADVGVAVGAHVLGLLGVGGKMDTHFRALGNGALATWAVRQGAKVGATPTTKGYEYDVRGQLPASSSDDEYEVYAEDEDLDVEGMALEQEPGAFAGYEIL